MASYVRAARVSMLALAISVPSVAHADERKAESKETAEQLAEQGYTSYEAGKFADAIGLYMKAFQLAGDARLLYNVASIYDRKLHERALAEDFYRRYLKSTTTEPALVKKATERLAEMKNEKDTLKDNADASAPAAAPKPVQKPAAAPTAHEGSALPTVGYVVAGAGLVLAGVGTVFGLAAKSKADDVARDCPDDRCVVADAVDKRDAASRDATLSTIFFGAGIAALGTGIVLVVLAPSSRPSRGGARVGVGLGGATLSGSF